MMLAASVFLYANIRQKQETASRATSVTEHFTRTTQQGFPLTMRVIEESWVKGLSPDIPKIHTTENWLKGGLAVNVAAGLTFIFVVALSGEYWIRRRAQIKAAVLRLKPHRQTVVVLAVFLVIFAGLNAVSHHRRLPKSNVSVIVRGWPYWQTLEIDPVLEREWSKSPLDWDLIQLVSQDLSDFSFSPTSMWKNVCICTALLMGLATLTEILVRYAVPRLRMNASSRGVLSKSHV